MQGVDVVLHTATLHKPHVASHTRQDFVDVNIACQCRFTCAVILLSPPPPVGIDNIVQARSKNP